MTTSLPAKKDEIFGGQSTSFAKGVDIPISITNRLFTQQRLLWKEGNNILCFIFRYQVTSITRISNIGLVGSARLTAFLSTTFMSLLFHIKTFTVQVCDFFRARCEKISAASVKKEFASNKFSVGIAFILFHRDPSSYWYGWVPSPGWHHNPIYTGICAQIVLNQCSATCLHCWVSKYIKVYFRICSSPYPPKNSLLEL